MRSNLRFSLFFLAHVRCSHVIRRPIPPCVLAESFPRTRTSFLSFRRKVSLIVQSICMGLHTLGKIFGLFPPWQGLFRNDTASKPDIFEAEVIYINAVLFSKVSDRRNMENSRTIWSPCPIFRQMPSFLTDVLVFTCIEILRVPKCQVSLWHRSVWVVNSFTSIYYCHCSLFSLYGHSVFVKLTGSGNFQATLDWRAEMFVFWSWGWHPVAAGLETMRRKPHAAAGYYYLTN